MINWLEKRRNFAIILTLLIAVEIFFFSSIPGIGLPSPNKLIFSIIYHFSAFFLLNFFLIISLNKGKKIKIKYIVIALVLSIIYSILDEIHQLFVPSRYPDFEDIITNNAGIFFSTLTYLYSKRLVKD